MDAGIATVGDAIRYPDARVTCSPVPEGNHLVPGVVVVFEVLSPSSGRTDRIDKIGEYRAVPSIRRYVIVEYAFVGLRVLERPNGTADWTTTDVADGDILSLPEIGIEIPVAEFYAGVDPKAAEDSIPVAGDPQ